MIREDLREEIEIKLKKIRDNPDVYDERARLVRDDIRAMADIYSFWIENPDLRKRLIIPGRNVTSQKLKKMAKVGTRQINDAWHFLMQFGSQRDFYKVINPEIIKGTNARINGDRGRSSFREKDVTLNFDYTPPSFERVPERVDEVIERIQQKHEKNPLETAIYAHLGIALVQPFAYGNKRTARLIQDRLLVDSGLPPAIISAGEAKLYFDVLKRVAPAYSMRDESGQVLFYNYIASKVNNGLDIILNDLGIGSLPENSSGLRYDSSLDLKI